MKPENNFKIEDNKVIIDDTEFAFDSAIEQFIQIESMLIILLKIYIGLKYNENVFGIDLLKKEVVWQIEKRKYPTGGKEQKCPFVGIVFYKNQLRLNNWCERYFIVNPISGQVLEEGETR